MSGLRERFLRAQLPLPAAIALLFVAGCGRPDSPPSPESVRGTAISSATATGIIAEPPAPSLPATNAPDVLENGFLRLGFDRLSSFKYDVYEFYSETNSGRPLLKSDDVIPPHVKGYDGRRVTVRGYVLPLRTKRQRVVEFLLLRDNGTCCFGPQARINHFIRARHPAGAEFESGRTYDVSGILRVGEV